MFNRVSAGFVSAALLGLSIQVAGSGSAHAAEINFDGTEGPCEFRSGLFFACSPFVEPQPTPTTIVEGDSANFIFHQGSGLEDGGALGSDYVAGIFRVSGVVDSTEKCAYTPRGSDLIPDDFINEFANGSWNGTSDAGDGLTVQVLGISDSLVGGVDNQGYFTASPYVQRLTAPPGSHGKYVCAISGAYIAEDGIFSSWHLEDTVVSSPRIMRITPVNERVFPQVALIPDSTTAGNFTVGDAYQVHAWIAGPIARQVNGRVLHRSLSVGFADELDFDGTATCEWESIWDLSGLDPSPTLEGAVSWTSAAYDDSYAGRYICAQQYVSYDSPAYGFIERWSQVATLYVNPPADSTGNRDLSRFSSTSVMEDLMEFSRSGCLRNPAQCGRAEFIELIGNFGDLEGRAMGSWDDERGKDAGSKAQRASTKQMLAVELASMRRAIEATGLVERFGKDVNWSPTLESQFAGVSKFDPEMTPIRQQGVADTNGLGINIVAPGEVKAGQDLEIDLRIKGANGPGTATTYVYALSKEGPKLIATQSTKVAGDSAALSVSGKTLASGVKEEAVSGRDLIVVTAFSPAKKESAGVAAAAPLRLVAK